MDSIGKLDKRNNSGRFYFEKKKAMFPWILIWKNEKQNQQNMNYNWKIQIISHKILFILL